MKRIARTVALVIMLAMLFALPAMAASPAYILSIQEKMIAVFDVNSGVWTSTGKPVDALANSCDAALLRCGLPLYSQQELTRALEDFCS